MERQLNHSRLSVHALLSLRANPSPSRSLYMVCNAVLMGKVWTVRKHLSHLQLPGLASCCWAHRRQMLVKRVLITQKHSTGLCLLCAVIFPLPGEDPTHFDSPCSVHPVIRRAKAFAAMKLFTSTLFALANSCSSVGERRLSLNSTALRFREVVMKACMSFTVLSPAAPPLAHHARQL